MARVGEIVPEVPRLGEPLTQAVVQRLFDYNPNSGHLVRKVGYDRHIGRIVGHNNRGRLRTMIARKNYTVTHIIWLHVFGYIPQLDIDHVDGNSLNNRLSNLRLATRSQNCANTRLSKANSSGLKGASYHRKRRRWEAVICKDGRSIHLGYFDTAVKAHDAYKVAAQRLFGEFAKF